jgi:hypothetical protein
MNINELFGGFSIFTSNEERKLLEKLEDPVRLSSFNEHDQNNIQNMIRKSLVKKIGWNDPMVMKNAID